MGALQSMFQLVDGLHAVLVLAAALEQRHDFRQR
jgi:hypothetical protein